MYPNKAEAPYAKSAPPPPTSATPFAKPHEGQWSSGLCDCFEDPSNCNSCHGYISFNPCNLPLKIAPPS